MLPRYYQYRQKLIVQYKTEAIYPEIRVSLLFYLREQSTKKLLIWKRGSVTLGFDNYWLCVLYFYVLARIKEKKLIYSYKLSNCGQCAAGDSKCWQTLPYWHNDQSQWKTKWAMTVNYLSNNWSKLYKRSHKFDYYYSHCLCLTTGEISNRLQLSKTVRYHNNCIC